MKTIFKNQIFLFLMLIITLTLPGLTQSQTYTLTINNNGNGIVSVNPLQTIYNSGDSVTLSALPFSGSSFVNWTTEAGTFVSTNNPHRITMSGNITLNANFQGSGGTPIRFELENFTTVSGYSGLSTGTRGIPSADFSNGNGRYSGGSGVRSNKTTFTGTSGTYDISFRWYDQSASITTSYYRLNIMNDTTQVLNTTWYADSAVGWHNRIFNNIQVNNGAVITIYAERTSSNESVIMDYVDFSIVGSTPVTYTLTKSTTGNGLIMTNPVGNVFENGTSITLTAVPNAGNVFTSWSGALTDTANPATLVMSTNRSVTASFTEGTTYTVTYNGNNSTDGTVPVGGSYAAGATATVAGNTGSLARSGYTFAGWNTDASGTGTNYTAGQTFTITANTTFYAVWVALTSDTLPIQAENTSYCTWISGTTIDNNNAGFTGTGFVNAPNAISTWLQINLTNMTAGDYQLNVRYATATAARGATLSVNNINFATGVFAATGSWTTWNNEVFTGINLTAGTNTIRLTATTSGGLSNIDRFELVSTTPSGFRVTYNGNGNTAGTVPVDTNVYQAGSTVRVMYNDGNLECTGYSFAGWNTSANGTGISYNNGDTFPIVANTILYAQWTLLPRYTITYVSNSETGGTVPVDTTHYIQGTAVVISGNTGLLVRSGYALVGWCTDSACSGTIYNSGDNLYIYDNTILYARWLPTFSITYNGNGNTSGTVPVDTVKYPIGTYVTIQSNTGSLVRTGYSFAGWSTNAAGTGTNYNPGEAFAISANTTLYARWITNTTYTVTYNGNGSTGGTVPVDGNAYYTGAAVTVLGNTGILVRTGYTFAGWNTTAAGTDTSYSPDETFTISANTTLYAQWTPVVTYTIVYNGNGNTAGSAPLDTTRYASGSRVTVRSNTGSLVRARCIFAGWNTNATGTGTYYSAGHTFSINSNVTLYAVWRSSVPNNQKLSITSRLLLQDGTPVGSSVPELRDMTVRLFTAQTGGTLQYTETFLSSNSKSVAVDNGYFVVRLGEGTTTDNLPSVVRSNTSLWAELIIAGITFGQRIPLTGAAYLINP